MVEFQVVLSVNTQVIHVDCQPLFGGHLGKNMIHECLKSQRGIAEPKEHDSRFIKTKGGDKHCFPLVFLSDPNVVISSSNIKLGEQGRCYSIGGPLSFFHSSSAMQS